MANYELVLCHHGVKGQQWGERSAPWYPIDAYRDHLKKSGYSKESIDRIMGKVNSGSSDRSIGRTVKKETKKLEKKHRKQREAATARLAKLREKKAVEKQQTDEKENAMKKGDLDYLQKNKDNFSNEEMKQLEDRYKANKQVDDLINERNFENGQRKAKELAAKMDVAINVAGKGADLIDKGSRVYNSVAKVVNAFTDNELPIIGEKNSKPKVTVNETIDETKGTINKVVTDANGNTKTTTTYTDEQKRKNAADALEKANQKERDAHKNDVYTKTYDHEGKLAYEKSEVYTDRGKEVTEHQYKEQGNNKKKNKGGNQDNSNNQNNQQNQKKENDFKDNTKKSENQVTEKRQSDEAVDRWVEKQRQKIVEEYNEDARYQEKRAKEEAEARAIPKTNYAFNNVHSMSQLNQKYNEASGTLASMYKNGIITEARYRKEIGDLISAFNSARAKV